MNNAIATPPPLLWHRSLLGDGVGDPLRRALTWGFAVLLSVYLALSGGGYDLVVRSEIGLIVWWLILLGVIVGMLPRVRVPRAGWIAVALLGGFLLWTWIGLSWTSSHELTLDEVGRISTYLGMLVLGLCILTRDTARTLVNGLGCGIAAVCGAAVLYKLEPSLFPADSARSLYATARLSYPFDYADGVGEYAAIGLPLVFYMATSGRTIAGRALATAATQLVLLCLAMTVSRGGIFAGLVDLVAFFALAPNRIPRLPTLAITAGGIAALMAALLNREALRDVVGAAPASQRHSMLAILCGVLAATGVAQFAVALIARRVARPSWLYVSRRGAQAVTGAIIAAVVLLVIVLFAAGTVSHLWHDFKLWEPPAQRSNQYFRLLSLAGSHRYQYWQVAWHAFKSSPFHGIGPGTFRYYWGEHTTNIEYILNAHSLWFETLAETGIVGWLLLAGFFAFIVIRGAIRALRPDGDDRAVIATATAAVIGFCAAAAFDWVWQIGVVPMVVLLLAAVTLLPGEQAVGQPEASGPRASSLVRRLASPRLALALGSVLAIILILIPLASTVALNASQRAYKRGEIATALADADTARAIEPGAASPYVQRAVLLEQLNDIPGASAAITAALAREPANSQLWVIASRIALEAGKPEQSAADYTRAKRLYPTSTVFIG
jgi:O-Antigen ligase